jgi:LmbE family N-acetylglucosaminyl deacetylase
VDINVTAQTEHANDDPKLMEEQESSLENRLSQLNSSLPPNLKSEAERVRDLNRGLRRLGLSGIDDGVGTGGQQFQRSWVNDVMTHIHNKSESEQVNEIIAQVQDHVALNPNEKYHTNHQEDDHVSMSSAASSSAASLQDIDDDSNEVDAPPPESCREIHAALISAQVHLAELIALFEVDDDDQAAIEFDASHGWKALSTTRRLLQKASRQWKNTSNSSANQPLSNTHPTTK